MTLAPEIAATGVSFEVPNWSAPLNEDEILAAVPKDCQVAGMFLLALQARAKSLNVALPMPRERYVAFNFYPLSELVPLLFQATKLFYPDQSPRNAMRTMGRAVPKALLASTVGRVVFSSAHGVHDVVEAMAKTYAINLRGSSAAVVESGSKWCVVHLQRVYHCLDSHHVGVFEGAMLHSGIEGSVKVAAVSSSEAHLLLAW